MKLLMKRWRVAWRQAFLETLKSAACGPVVLDWATTRRALLQKVHSRATMQTTDKILVLQKKVSGALLQYIVLGQLLGTYVAGVVTLLMDSRAKRLTSHCEVEVCNTKKRDAQDDPASGSASWLSRWMFHDVSMFRFDDGFTISHWDKLAPILCEDPWGEMWLEQFWAAAGSPWYDW